MSDKLLPIYEKILKTVFLWLFSAKEKVINDINWTYVPKYEVKDILNKYISKQERKEPIIKINGNNLIDKFFFFFLTIISNKKKWK